MARFDRPEELGAHLESVARTWNAQLGDLDASGIQIFGRLDAVARSWAAMHREVLAPFELGYSELSTLGILHTTPGERRSPTELRSLIGQTSAGMTRILDKLERAGLLRREAIAEDGRRVDVVLTARGRRLAEKAFRALTERHNELLGALEKREADALVRALDTLLGSFASRAPS